MYIYTNYKYVVNMDAYKRRGVFTKTKGVLKACYGRQGHDKFIKEKVRNSKDKHGHYYNVDMQLIKDIHLCRKMFEEKILSFGEFRERRLKCIEECQGRITTKRFNHYEMKYGSSEYFEFKKSLGNDDEIFSIEAWIRHIFVEFVSKEQSQSLADKIKKEIFIDPGLWGKSEHYSREHCQKMVERRKELKRMREEAAKQVTIQNAP